MSWYGIDYSGSRSPVYVFGNYSRLFPKADPANTVYRNHIANEVRKARQNSPSDYRAHRGYSADKWPDKSYDSQIKSSVRAAYANNQAQAASARRAGALRAGALGAGALGAGLAVRSLYRRHQARKAARLAAQQEQ